MSENTENLDPAFTEIAGAAFLDAISNTATVVAAYVSNTSVGPDALQDLIRKTYATFCGLNEPAAPEQPAEPEVKKPTAAQIRKSITPDALISFIDGKPYKMLKRHLSVFGLDPAGYRARYGLPDDYPMTSPNYSAQRSALARAAGLGQRAKLSAVA